jgi:hypothetical protein
VAGKPVGVAGEIHEIDTLEPAPQPPRSGMFRCSSQEAPHGRSRQRPGPTIPGTFSVPQR